MRRERVGAGMGEKDLRTNPGADPRVARRFFAHPRTHRPFAQEAVKKSTNGCCRQPLTPSLSRRERAIERCNLHVYLPLNEEDALTSHADRSPSPSGLPRAEGRGEGLPPMSGSSISSQPLSEGGRGARDVT